MIIFCIGTVERGRLDRTYGAQRARLTTVPPTPKTPPARHVRGLRTVALRNRRWAETRVHAQTRDTRPRLTRQLRVRGGPQKTGDRREKNKNRLETRKHSPPVKTKCGDTTAPVCSTARRTTDPMVFTDRNWNRLIRTRTTYRARRRGRSGRVEKTHRAHSLTLTHTRARTNEYRNRTTRSHTHAHVYNRYY